LSLLIISYITDKEEKILENQQVIKIPVVRNGRRATVGYQPEIWQVWQ
jgi:arsenate reductase